MRKRVLLAIASVLLLLSTAAADPGDTLWTRTYGGSAWDWGESVEQISDGGYIIAGYTESFGAGNGDVWLLKTDSSGDTLWTRTYGGSECDDGRSVQQTSDGGYIIAGFTNSFGAGAYDVWLVKTDSSGDTLWTRTYGGSSLDRPYSVQQTSDGGYIIAGHTESFGAGNNDVYLVKTDSSGDTLWTRTYGGSSNDIGYSVQQTPDGGYIIAGNTYSFGAGYYDVWLLKTDSAGDTLWTCTYGGSENDNGHSVQETSDGGYIIAGQTSSFGAGDYDVYLVCVTGDGSVVEPDGESNNPVRFSLSQNYPNPFNTLTVIEYELPAGGRATLAVYNLVGQRLATLVEKRQQPGYRSIIWDASDFSSGVYFYRLTAGDFTESRRMILVK